MSSVYRVLCLSHDPALDHGEYRSRDAAEAAIRGGVDGHTTCDLLIGRYSYPLVEVGCPPAPAGDLAAGQRRCGGHATTEWVDVAWLRILAAVHQGGTDQMRQLTSDSHLWHWSPERLRRLRNELGIGLEAQ